MGEWKPAKINYELWIHRVPDDLQPPLPPERQYLQETYEVWKRVVDSRVTWRVARIDQWNHNWIDIRFKNDAGEFEDHSLAIDEGCFEKVESSEYEIEVESPDTEH